MGLESLLTKVDEAIWKQYEKATNWAYNNYGWSKYDLATMCGRAGGACMVGYGTYFALSSFGYSSLKGIDLAMGVSTSIIGGCTIHFAPKRYKMLEETETQLAIQGVTQSPEFGIIRPMTLLMYTAFASIMVSGEFFRDLPKQYVGGVEEYRLLGAAMGITFCGFLFSLISSDYFSSQIPKPPKAKKSVWQALYEPITKYLRKAVPLPEAKPEGVKISSEV